METSIKIIDKTEYKPVPISELKIGSTFKGHNNSEIHMVLDKDTIDIVHTICLNHGYKDSWAPETIVYPVNLVISVEPAK